MTQIKCNTSLCDTTGYHDHISRLWSYMSCTYNEPKQINSNILTVKYINLHNKRPLYNIIKDNIMTDMLCIDGRAVTVKSTFPGALP